MYLKLESVRLLPKAVGGGWRRGTLPLKGERKGRHVGPPSLGGGVDVLGLGEAGQMVLVVRQAAEEDGAADAEDGGAPAEAVRPGVVVVALVDQLVELDRVDDESDDLEDHCRQKEANVSGTRRRRERAAF